MRWFLFLILIQTPLYPAHKARKPESALYLGSDQDVVRWLGSTHTKVICVAKNREQEGLIKGSKNVRTFVQKLCPYKNEDRSAVTLKQFLFNTDLACEPFTLLFSDLEGEEEGILEDLLHFAYNSKCTLYIRFRADLWKSHSPKDFEGLFSYFYQAGKETSTAESLELSPTSTLIFRGIDELRPFVKPNIPAFIIAYNQPTFIKGMVSQLEKYTKDITIIDNKSTFVPLLDYYEQEYPYTLLRQKENYGHMVYTRKEIKKLAGGLYLLTDPDLLFNPQLPPDFLSTLIAVSEECNAGKVGFALFIDSDDIREDLHLNKTPIKEWESKFWEKPVSFSSDPNLEMYWAAIDTTFCLINETKRNWDHIRIAGDFTCMHIPWHKGFEERLQSGEYEAYLQGGRSSNFFKINKKSPDEAPE